MSQMMKFGQNDLNTSDPGSFYSVVMGRSNSPADTVMVKVLNK